jgi:hypothetical protein
VSLRAIIRLRLTLAIVPPEPDARQAQGIEGSPVKVVGTITCDIRLGTLCIPNVELKIIDSTSPFEMLVGSDLIWQHMNPYTVTLHAPDWGYIACERDGTKYRIPLGQGFPTAPKEEKALTLGNQVVPAKSYFSLKCTLSKPVREDCLTIFTPRSKFTEKYQVGCEVQFVCLKAGESQFTVVVGNPLPYNTWVYDGATVGTVERFDLNWALEIVADNAFLLSDVPDLPKEVGMRKPFTPEDVELVLGRIKNSQSKLTHLSESEQARIMDCYARHYDVYALKMGHWAF